MLFTTSPGKSADARRLGADDVVESRNEEEMRRHAGSFDFILDAVSADHDLNAYLGLLKRVGTLTLVGGAPEKPAPVAAFALIMGRRRLSAQAIGGIARLRRWLDFCGEHGIPPDIERIGVQRYLTTPTSACSRAT